SSSVAMTAVARGNVPAAIFNASLSSILGIFLTPLIVSIFASTGGNALPIGETVLNLFVLLFLPFLLGQILNPLVYNFILPYKKYINIFDKLVILLLVFSSFADSVYDGLWTKHGAGLLLETFVGAAILLTVALAGTTFAARAFGFKKSDEITAVFCGSKKTLAGGVPMAKLIFGSAPQIGLIVLPIMFYHQLQLLVCTVLANRYASRPISDKNE
ncbi:MAG: bile acid:sodium symporter, partial [Opitutales bacterium]|nr:bile acid:sodium symporter [Opitutales bacterium]